MSAWRLATALAALGSAASGGAFLVWSTVVPAGLARLPAAQGMAAMQGMNVAATRSAAFMTLLFAPGAVAAVLAVHAVVGRERVDPTPVVAGSLVYLVGVVGMTVAFHVPRNDVLASMDAATQHEAFRSWLDAWVLGNHVRTASGLVASVLLGWSLR